MSMLVYLIVSHKSVRLCSVWEESAWRWLGCILSDPCPDVFEVTVDSGEVRAKTVPHNTSKARCAGLGSQWSFRASEKLEAPVVRTALGPTPIISND